ncbi:2-oxoglutarate dehydrogenase E1 subunit family protein, partial [Nocardioides sp.]|uniref:2-oxoglutarate dehydrogenase E1 subunit family protein n=1 Tax=Nocardioides sp. TaxID=35761 RepID=UPI002ED984C9
MPQSPGSHPDVPSTQHEGPDFGANEWLVEEMFEQYQQDPDSVDATWAAYFRANGNGSNGTT